MELRLADGTAAGTAELRRQDGDTLFTVTARLPPGLWRIVAHGEAGTLALGVMEGSGVLRRRFSPALAGRVGAVQCFTAHCCAPARTESEWQGCRGDEAPGLPPLPPGSLCRRRGAGCALALPWREDGPFPWAEVFCLARVGTMAGRLWAFYTLDGGGRPVFCEEN